MAQAGKRTSRSKQTDTVPIIVLVPQLTEAQPEVSIETLLPHLHLIPKPQEVAVNTLKDEIDKFITKMLPIMDGLPVPQSDKPGVDSLALALAVTASGQIGIAGIASGGLQVQASITVTFAKKKAT